MSVNVLGVNNTLVATGGIATIGRGLIDGRVKAMLDQYVIGGSAEVTGSTITIGGTLPVGANIVAIVLSVSAAQTSATFSAGDAGSATRYVSASTALQTAVTPLVISGKNYVVTGTSDTAIVLTTGGATLSAGTLYAAIFYTQD